MKYIEHFNESKKEKSPSDLFEDFVEGYYLAVGKTKYTSKGHALSPSKANVFSQSKVVLYDKNSDKKFKKYMKENPLKDGKVYCTLYVDDEGNIDSWV